MSATRTPLDAAARERIGGDLDRTLVVEAGAGTGKTQSLIERIVSLISRGEATLDRVAAITFTRSAASELRDRVRSELEGRSGASQTPEAERGLLERALEEIDYAAIQTIDSFALSLLRERPLEAGLPPVITPLDEIEAELAFRDEWSAWLDRELEGDGPFAGAVTDAVRLGLPDPVGRLYDVVWSFHQNRDLIGAAALTSKGDAPRIAAQRVVAAMPELQALLTHAPGGDDKLEPEVRDVLDFARELRAAGPDTDEATMLLAERAWSRRRLGRKGSWGSDEHWRDVVERARDLLSDLRGTA